MAAKESAIVNEIMLAASTGGARLFKNVRGMFFTLDHQRKVYAGVLAAGASDLIGYTPVTITADMVGKQVALITCIEVKTDKGIVTPAQERFCNHIAEVGGIAGIARSVDDVRKIKQNALDRLSDL